MGKKNKKTHVNKYEKQKQRQQNKHKQLSKEIIQHKETVTIEEWDQFKRWRKHHSELRNVLESVSDGWKSFVRYLIEELGYHPENNDIMDLCGRSLFLYYQILKGNNSTNHRRVLHEHPSSQSKKSRKKEKKNKMKIFVSEITIIDITEDPKFLSL